MNVNWNTPDRGWLGIASGLMCVVILAGCAMISHTAHAQDRNIKPNDDEPSYTISLYNGGQLIDVIESKQFPENVREAIKIIGINGKATWIINSGSCICREIDKSDVTELSASRERTKRLQKLLTLKRQEAALRKEQQEQKQLIAEISEAEKALNTTAPITEQPTPPSP